MGSASLAMQGCDEDQSPNGDRDSVTLDWITADEGYPYVVVPKPEEATTNGCFWTGIKWTLSNYYGDIIYNWNHRFFIMPKDDEESD